MVLEVHRAVPLEESAGLRDGTEETKALSGLWLAVGLEGSEETRVAGVMMGLYGHSKWLCRVQSSLSRPLTTSCPNVTMKTPRVSHSNPKPH